MVIHSSVQTIFSFIHIEGITLGTGEEVVEVAERASCMGMDRVGEVVDRTSEGHAAGVYGTDFTARSLERVGQRPRLVLARS